MNPEEINYSGQYLNNTQFRLKVRTGGDLSKVANDCVVGEMFLVTGACDINGGNFYSDQNEHGYYPGLYICMSGASEGNSPIIAEVATSSMTNMYPHFY